MQKIVLDVEMCRVQNQYDINRFPYRDEIIQIGAVKLDENYQVIDQFASYVRPQYGKIDYYITNLTGIHDREVRKAPVLENVLDELIEWFGSDDVNIYTWSSMDYYQFRHEIEGKNLADRFRETFLEKALWTDYQVVFRERFDLGRDISLRESLELTEIDVEGRLHDALADAYHTGLLIEKLENNPEYQLATVTETLVNAVESLTFSLGELMKRWVSM